MLTRRGKPVAAMVPLEDLKSLEALEDRADLTEMDEALRGFEASGECAVVLEDVARELGINLPKTVS